MSEMKFNIENQPDLIDQLEFAVIIVERAGGKILFINRRVEEDMTSPRESIIGRHYRDVFWPDFIRVYENLVQECRDGEEHTASYYWAGRAIWEQLSVHSISLEGGSEAILLSITNVSDLMNEKEKYERLALFDAVLKLPNSKKLEADIRELRDTNEVTLICFHIDFYDDFNELYGWEIGDKLLRSIRNWLFETEKDKAQLYRIENGFALLGTSVTMDMTVTRAKNIIQRFKSPWEFRVGENILSKYLTIRLGVVFGRYIKEELHSMLMRTLRAPQNQDGYAVYDDRIDDAVYEELALRDTLINCVMKDMAGFEVYYQPIVKTGTRKWAGLEALCRWTAPDGTKVPPSVFIPVAEKLDLVHRIDNWVCGTAVRYCVSLGLHKQDFFLDVNFSPHQNITDQDVEMLKNLLEETGFPPEKLIIEITENAKVDFAEESLKKFDNIRKQGVALSLDDFGTGYSSLENLIKLSAFSIKIDKIFADEIETDEYRQYLLYVLVDIAKHLNMKVVLEGVETERQHELLKNYDIDYFQGYLFAKPLSAEALRRMI